jgi:hypothetical protein
MLMFCLADPTTGAGVCNYRLAPGPVGSFIATSDTIWYAAARRLQGATVYPVRGDGMSTIQYEVLTDCAVSRI